MPQEAPLGSLAAGEGITNFDGSPEIHSTLTAKLRWFSPVPRKLPARIVRCRTNYWKLKCFQGYHRALPVLLRGSQVDSRERPWDGADGSGGGTFLNGTVKDSRLELPVWIEFTESKFLWSAGHLEVITLSDDLLQIREPVLPPAESSFIVVEWACWSTK